MLYLLAVFLAPLALLLAGKPFQAILNAALWLIAVLCWLTGIFALIGFGLWAVGFLHAAVVIHGKRADARTSRIVNAVQQR